MSAFHRGWERMQQLFEAACAKGARKTARLCVESTLTGSFSARRGYGVSSLCRGIGMFMLLLAVGALFPQAARAAASATVTVAAKQV